MVIRLYGYFHNYVHIMYMSDVGYSQRWMSDVLLNANASDILCPVTIWDMKVKVHAMVIRQIYIYIEYTKRPLNAFAIMKIARLRQE